MKKRKCLIVENDLSSMEVVKSFVEMLPFIELSITCSTFKEAYSILITEKIDLLLLDIDLPDKSGFDLLNIFDSLPPTIITTSHIDYAVKSYEIGKVTDYLLKPFSFDRFVLAINRALAIKIGHSSIIDLPYIFIKMGRGLRRFEINEINFIEAYSIYCKVHTCNQYYVVNEIISELEERLPKSLFIRVHKSFIVNLTKITGIDPKNIFINDQEIPIGRTYKQTFAGFLRLVEKQKYIQV
jgi:DNA-binding LytR/AlgR family response regulator